MNRIKLFCRILIGIMILSSCSNDDDSLTSSDIIIGKWRTIERYESNVQVELSTCEPHFYTEYRSDKSIIGDRIITSEFPAECGIIDIELGWSWNNLGNNQYRIKYLEEEGSIVKIYKDGENLVFESPNRINKTIREPF